MKQEAAFLQKSGAKNFGYSGPGRDFDNAHGQESKKVFLVAGGQPFFFRERTVFFQP
jgi:hypothetical protein